MMSREQGYSVTRRRALLLTAAGISVCSDNRIVSPGIAQPLDQAQTYLIFQAAINSQTVNQLLAATIQAPTSDVYILISSSGGEVVAGITAYNLLKIIPKKLTTHNVGNIDSIGNAIFLAGKQRFASPHATFMFHGVSRGIGANMNVSTNTLAEWLDGNRADERRIPNIVKEQTKLTREQIAAFFQESRTMNATEALNVGIIEKISEIQIPAGSRVNVI
jgi:ATP-dependent Clp protease, protease subunit